MTEYCYGECRYDDCRGADCWRLRFLYLAISLLFYGRIDSLLEFYKTLLTAS